MIFNNIRIGIRNILKSKLYSFINAFGLSIAIAFCVLIYLFIQDEKSFDQFHSKKDQIYRVHSERTRFEPDDYGNTVSKSAWIQTGVPLRLKEEAPEVLLATGFNEGYDAIFTKGNKIFNEEITFVHKDFFSMFDFKDLKGDRDQFLSDKSHIVLSKSTAEKYFEDSDPLGEEIELSVFNEAKVYTVIGVIEDAPQNSSLDYHEALVRADNRPYYERNLDSWTSSNAPAFVLLNENSGIDQLSASLEVLYGKYVQPEIDKFIEENDWTPSSKSRFDALSLNEVHLSPDVSWTKVSDPQYSLILSGIAGLILLIACINYISLSMSNASSKRVEVGIRKAVGADRKQLIGQFLTESLLLSFFAMIIAFGLIILFLPYFNSFTDKAIDLASNLGVIAIILIVFSVSIGFVSGIYPSFILSAFKAIQVLRSRQSSKINASITRPLVILQFAISAFLIICSIVMLQQMKFITSKDLGYNQEQILVIPTYTGWSDDGEVLLDRLRVAVSDNSEVVRVSGTNASFNRGYSRNGYQIDGKIHQAFNYRVDADYIETLGIKLKLGRAFDSEIVSDRGKTMIVNEALVEDMGWDDPLSETLNWREDSTGGWKIIGVVENYHFQSLERNIEPMFMHMNTEEAKITTILVKIEPTNMPETIEYVQAKWGEVAPDKPFDYNFLDEDVARQYESYEKWSSIMGLSTIFGILIACLGLFGLAGINTLNRTKEIGIRKVLGAEIRDILIMMNRPFVIMASVSFVIAAPASWWVMDQWLGDFQYSISMGWQLFAGSLIVALMFALVTVSYHSIRAALVNPVDTLKYE